ncbi:hypothetical protein CC86DRAFT_404101 [Ophiobolus disseminans]|uniref:Uncharacterized protein n=1 Tax=Ophiobolus disseminans TaxID=1469910 RepID=A0A6A7A838_9PLEO|nr:hypothetical protein CC86DRAFT_404101 [Ophiobolus disseminans]
MTSTLNPTAPIWAPSSTPRDDSAPSTPSSFSLTATPFVSWPHHEFYPHHVAMQHAPHEPHYFDAGAYFAPPPAYEPWAAAHAEEQGYYAPGPACDAYGFVDAQDPFARQMRQVEMLKAGGYYPDSEGSDGAWVNGAAWTGGAAWTDGNAAGKKKFKKGKKFKKARKEWKGGEEKGGKKGGRTDEAKETRKDIGVDVDGQVDVDAKDE